MMEMELLVTRRLSDDISTPTYQAEITVLISEKAVIAIAIPVIVRSERSLCRVTFFITSFERVIFDKL